MAQQYIFDVANWAEAFHLAACAVEEVVLPDSDRAILTFQVRFASGHRVCALSSRPANLRSKKGHIRIDEAAFHEDLPGLLKAAVAVVVWGGRVAIWSTHHGVDNPFNRLIERVRWSKTDRRSSHELDYSLHRYPLQLALDQGLYQRICLVNGETWSEQKQQAWVNQLYADYGPTAGEELDCVPFAPGEGKVFNRIWFGMAELYPRLGETVRFWDFAATAKEVAGKHHYYTAGVKLNRTQDTYTVCDAQFEQIGPGGVEEFVLGVAQQDGRGVKVAWEQEGGSAGSLFGERLRSQLQKTGFRAEAVKPYRDKVSRAMPLATEAKRGNVLLWPGLWNDAYLNALHQFDGSAQPLVNDLTDASSGAFALLAKQGTMGRRVEPRSAVQSARAINF